MGSDTEQTNQLKRGTLKFNKAVGVPHPNVYLLIKKLKEDALEVQNKVTQMELCLPNEKRRRKYIELDERIQRRLNQYLEEDFLKCIRVAKFACCKI